MKARALERTKYPGSFQRGGRYVVVFRASGIFNFLHPDFMLVGALLYTSFRGTDAAPGFSIAVVISVLVTCLLGGVVSFKERDPLPRYVPDLERCARVARLAVRHARLRSTERPRVAMLLTSFPSIACCLRITPRFCVPITSGSEPT